MMMGFIWGGGWGVVGLKKSGVGGGMGRRCMRSRSHSVYGRREMDGAMEEAGRWFTTMYDGPGGVSSSSSWRVSSSAAAASSSATAAVAWGGYASQMVVDADELKLLRQRYKFLEIRLEAAVTREDFMAAAELRDAIAALRMRDPQMRRVDLDQMLKAALAVEDYQECCRIRDELDVVRKMLPQFRLEGNWVGVYEERGVVRIQIAIDGDQLVATKTSGELNIPIGELTFRADLSPDGMVEAKEDPVERALHMFPDLTYQRFKGHGRISDSDFSGNRWVEGELIIFEENVIAFVWRGFCLMMVFERVVDI
mmetsp:Transcript_17791/g.36925  ORF Transcript_17791/g.36925 Transcript_17791/m.36925 type:complete len:310 (+) Transcript_17791:19-948(+)